MNLSGIFQDSMTNGANQLRINFINKSSSFETHCCLHTIAHCKIQLMQMEPCNDTVNCFISVKQTGKKIIPLTIAWY